MARSKPEDEKSKVSQPSTETPTCSTAVVVRNLRHVTLPAAAVKRYFLPLSLSAACLLFSGPTLCKRLPDLSTQLPNFALLHTADCERG